jgi:hypothetical protein
MKRELKINKTEESIFTLLSLFILIQQAVESIYGQEEILSSEFDSENKSFHNLVTDTIHEALNYQILIKSCAFLDEWNKVFGVKTEKRDEIKIKAAKSIAKPAAKQIYEWKQLRDFRNEAIAHNHRDKFGKNIYISSKGYHSPDTDGEIYLMVYCIKKMIDVMSFFFKEELNKVVKGLQFRKSPPKQKRISARKIEKIIKEISDSIDEPISRIIMREHFISSFVAEKSPPVLP